MVTVQALGGTGGLRVGADFLRRFAPAAQVWISDPCWENHRALFESAGFQVNTYPYYDAATRGLDFDGMIARSSTLPPARSSCCTPAATTRPASIRRPEQWSTILEVVRARGQVPFLDMAYQGFGEGIDADAPVVRRFAETPGPLFVASSFSKSFSLYGERVGALSIVAADRDEAARVLSQVKRVVRGNYSSPPTFGAQVVATILDSPELSALWDAGAQHDARAHSCQSRERWSIGSRNVLRATDFRFVLEQRGMFSYSGLDRRAGRPAAQRIRRLRDRQRAHLRRGAQ